MAERLQGFHAAETPPGFRCGVRPATELRAGLFRRRVLRIYSRVCRLQWRRLAKSQWPQLSFTPAVWPAGALASL